MRKPLLALASLLLLAIPSAAAPAPAEALRRAYAALRDREWQRAATELRALREASPRAPEAAEAHALEVRALLLADRPREAVTEALAFLAARPKDPWAGRVVGNLADAYAKAGATEDEVRTLRARVEVLAGPGHRGEIAALFVRLGDEDAGVLPLRARETPPLPGAEATKPDPGRALDAYRKALEVGVAPRDLLRVRAQVARTLEALGKHAEAVAAWDALVREDPKGPGADPVAWLVGRGRARLAAGDGGGARADLLRALASRPEDAPRIQRSTPDDALRIDSTPEDALRIEALRLLAKERLGVATSVGRTAEGDSAFEEAVGFLRRAATESAASTRVDPAVSQARVDAQRDLAVAFAARGRFAESATEWRALLDRQPSHAQVPEWRHALAQALLDAGRFEEAVAEWRTLVASFPNHPLWQPAQAKIAQARFEAGRALAEAGDPAGAIAAWRRFAEETPTDPRAPEGLVEAGLLLRERKDFEAAVALWGTVAGRYAASPQAPRARLLAAQTLEDSLSRLEEAVRAYEALASAHPKSREAAEARERLARLRRKHLEVRSERVVGTRESPVLRVVTRNVPILSVRVYRLDAEDYFRRKHGLLGVESLQVEVVKPDATAEWRLEPYAPYALLEADRPVPVPGPGAYVVVAGDEDLTSTTLFLVSDVDVVAKVSANREVFAWARDRATGKPVAGARVLATDGSSVFADGKTAEDGVFRQDTNRTTTAVLVLAGEQVASTQVGPGATYAEGWSTKAFVHVDRPAYRPGQTVRWRAVLRTADGGGYRNPGAVDGAAVLVDARGAEVERRKVRSSDQGSFDGEFALDGAAPLGDWSVRLDAAHVSSSIAFRVLEYRKPEFTLEVVPEKPSYPTGEEVRATIRLAYAFGGPVSGAPVRWEVVRVAKDFAPTAVDDYSWYFQDPESLARAREAARTAVGATTAVARGEARTDGRGEAKVSFPTSAAEGDAEYVVRASAVDVTRRFVVDEGRVPVVRRDHAAVVTVDRRVVRPRQEVTATVVTVDATQSPVSRAGKATLVRVRRAPVLPDRRRGDGEAVAVREEETEVASTAATTDARGRAEVRFAPPGPGTFRVRWQSPDARGAVVSAHATFESAGDAEDLAKDARVVASRRAYAEGEVADLWIQSPIHGVTALVTFEGERVLSYRFVEITGPSTGIQVPVEGAWAPNAFACVAIPGKDRLLEAKDEVVVLRHLDVKVEPSKAVATPGEEIEVLVRTTDAAGKPVAAEVGISVADQALFSVAPDRTPAVRPFFFDRRRAHVVRTATSIGARVYGTTRATDKSVLEHQRATGGDEAALAADALRIAREAFGRGDLETAAAHAVLAVQADPTSWDANAFLGELRVRAGADARVAVLLKGADEKELLAEVARNVPPGAGSPAPTPVTAAGTPPPAEGGSAVLDEAALEGPEQDDMVGAGGGAGGSFRGRGGSRNLRTGGGGRVAPVTKPARVDDADKQVIAGYLGLLADAGDGDAPDPAVRRRFADVAAWEPHVATDATGVGRIRVTLPDNLASWRATAYAASPDSRFGEARATVVARKPLLLRVDAPRFLVQGDRATLASAVHNERASEVVVRVSLAAEGGALSTGDDSVRVRASDRATFDRDLSVEAPGTVRLSGEARGPDGSDRVETSLPVLARGVLRVEGRSGSVSTSRGDLQETFLDVPEGAVAGGTRLTVLLSPGVSAAVLEALARLDLYPYGCVEQTVHRFLPAVWARAALSAAGSPDAKRLSELDEAVRRGVARLKNLGNRDGSHGWFAGGSGDAAMTAYALLGLRGAQEAGHRDLEAPVAASAQALRGLVRGAESDRQALAHWALASVGALDAEAYAITFRRREELSATGLAWLTLAALAAERRFDADEAARLLLSRAVEEGDLTRWPGRPEDCFTGSDREATGFAVRALVLAGVVTHHAERGLRWLLASRPDGGFGSTKDAAAFVGAASAWIAKSREAGFGGRVEVLVNGAVARTVAVEPGSGLAPRDRRLSLDPASLRAGRNALGFRLSGEGEVHWAARLEVVVPLRDEDAPESHGLAVERLYLDPEILPLESADGEVVSSELPTKPGYEVIRPAARPRVEAKSRERAASGERLLVRLALTAPRDLDYVLVEDPLPAGFEVLDETAAGPFDWQERRDDRQVFFLSRVKAGTVVLRYALQAVHPGAFTALPTTAYAMYAPEVSGRGAANRVTVGPGDRPHDPESGPTPDELWARAKALLEARRWDEADAALRALRDGHALRDEVLEDLEAGLLRAALERKDARATVSAREALVRRNPARIPSTIEAALAIARAYADVGDARVASGLFRDLDLRVFALEASWPETLAARGREAEGLSWLEGPLAAHPVANATASAALRRAMRWREVARPVGHPGRTGAPMHEEAAEALRRVTAHYAETTAAAPASYALVEALRTVRALDEAEAEATAFPRRFPDSHFLDDVLGFLVDVRMRRFEAQPSRETAQPVLEAARRLAKERFRRPDGSQEVSELRPRAHHAIARVLHALGDLAGAVEAYRHAQDVEDAREALAWLVEPRLEAPEVVASPVEGAATLPLRSRNAKEVRLRAYPVDLQVLFSVRKSLEGLNRIDLAGIVPAKEWTVPLAGAPYAWTETQVPLPVGTDAPGAFLVLAKAGDLEAATMVLKSDLRAVLQRVGDKARVHVTDATGAPVRDAYVTVSDGSAVKARGRTDGRGVFEAPGAGPRAVAVASAGDRYALAR